MMTLKELESMLPTLNTDQLLNVLTAVARENGIGSFKYCTVMAEIHKRLEEKKN